MSGKQKGDGLGEVCPYCGRKFKRLKSHLNHCKLAPAVTPSISLDTPSKDAPLKTTVVKNKNKTATTTSQDKLSSSNQNNTKHLSDLKTKSKNKKLVKSAKENTSIPLATSQTTNPTSLSEDAARLKRRWQGRNNQETEKDKLSAFLMENDRKSSPKAATLGKITLAANVLKGTAIKEAKRDVTATKPQNTHRSKASLSLPAEETRHLAPLIAATVSVQEPLHKALQKPHPKNDQDLNPSHLKPNIQTHFQEEVKQGHGQDLMRVKVSNSPVSHTFKVEKTSVWEHIKGGLLSRKYEGQMISPLVWTKLQVGNAASQTSAFTISSPQSAMTLQKDVALEGPSMRPPDPSRPLQSSPIQGLLPSHSDSLSSKPRSLEWMSSVTAGYHEMEVYRPPGRTSQGHEQFWTKPSPEPPPPKPLPDTLVSDVLGGSKRPQGPSSSLSPGRQAHSPSIVPLAERRFGDVTLNELIPWLADRTPQSPREGLAIFKNGWQWYYKRYIDVRKGGIGGIGMLLAGYCLLSYVWSYPHLKHERWRKYH